MSTTTGNNYFTKSMNSIIEIDDGAGTVISDGVIHCNAFSANDLIITNLNSSSITNSGTISSNVINATTINTSTIQTSGTLNLTGSTTNLNGTQADTRTYISNYNNNSVELGTNTNLSYIDFHSSNTANNYDARISSQGVGDLSVLSNSLNVYTNTGITAYSGTLNIEPVIGSAIPSVLNVATINSNNIISNGATITNLNSTTGNITTLNSDFVNTGYVGIEGDFAPLEFLNSSNTKVAEHYINPSINAYKEILYPPTSRKIFTILGNDTLILDDTKATTTQINSTIGNITTINSNSIISNFSTITNLTSTTGNITTINTNNFTTQTIEPKTISSNVSLFTTATSNLNIGGNNAINIGKTGNFNTEITNLSGFGPCVKFHSSTLNYNDYDSRIIGTSGTSTTGEGNLTFNAKAVNFFNQSSNSPELYLGFDRFYFKPWTTFYSATYTATTSHSNFINFPTGSTCPTGPSGSVVSYRSTIIGNSMYVNFSYYQPSAGGFVGTTGVYQYKLPLPSGYIFDSTNLISSGTTTPYGTRLGSGCMKIVGTTSTVTVGVFWTQQNSTNGLMLFEEAGSNVFNYTPQAQSNGRYSYASTGIMTVKFDAIIPIST